MAPLNLQTKIKLNSGYEIPALGYGVSQHSSHSHPFKNSLLTGNKTALANVSALNKSSSWLYALP